MKVLNINEYEIEMLNTCVFLFITTGIKVWI
jgi:hypothetical protein